MDPAALSGPRGYGPVAGPLNGSLVRIDADDSPVIKGLWCSRTDRTLLQGFEFHANTERNSVRCLVHLLAVFAQILPDLNTPTSVGDVIEMLVLTGVLVLGFWPALRFTHLLSKHTFP